MKENSNDLIVIGAGPSGLTAAIYASRAELTTLVIAGNPSGGQLTTTSDVENFPGFPDGVLGPELISLMTKQTKKFGAEFIEENVIGVTGSMEDGFTVETDSLNKYKGRALIVATGASAKWLGLESEQRLRGKGVSACATCDGYFFKNKVVAVVGGGDAAMEEATFLTKFATKVFVLVRRSKSELRASKIMQKRAFDNPKIEFLFNVDVKEVLGTDSVVGIKIFDSVGKNSSTLGEVQGLFLALGHTPNTEFLKGFITLDERGYIKVTNNTKSSREGVFVAGDVGDSRYRQAVSAAGFGCMAAIDAEKFLAIQK